MVPRSRHLGVVLVVAAPVMVGLTVNHLSDANAVAVTASATASVSSGSNADAGALYQNDWRVSLWEVVFDIHDVAEVRRASRVARRVTRFTDMRYFVGPFPDMMVTATPIWGSFNQTILDNYGKAEMDLKSVGRPRLPAPADDPPRRELLLGRDAQLCDSAISVQTDGARRYSWPTPNSFVISNNLIWPKATATYYAPPGKPVATADVDSAQALLTLTDQAVPYDYRELVNQGRATLPAIRAPGGFRQISRTINYTIVRHHTMTLEFLPQCRPDGSRPTRNPPECVKNLVGTPGLKCITCTAVSDYYAVDGAHYFFIHPNVEVRLKIGGEDVTTITKRRPDGTVVYFDVVRLRRSFESGLRSDDEGDGNYVPLTRGSNGWIYDGTIVPETGDMATPNWYDMPAPGESRQPTAWPRTRVLQEFLLGVKDFPEFGFLYYAVIVDTKPGGYRVRKSEGRKITADEWCRIKRSNGPNWGGQRALDDSGWRQAPPI